MSIRKNYNTDIQTKYNRLFSMDRPEAYSWNRKRIRCCCEAIRKCKHSDMTIYWLENLEYFLNVRKGLRYCE
jgi:hypothetical protein